MNGKHILAAANHCEVKATLHYLSWAFQRHTESQVVLELLKLRLVLSSNEMERRWKAELELLGSFGGISYSLAKWNGFKDAFRGLEGFVNHGWRWQLFVKWIASVEKWINNWFNLQALKLQCVLGLSAHRMSVQNSAYNMCACSHLG